MKRVENTMSDWRTRLKEVIDDREISLPDLALQAEYDYVTLWKAVSKETVTIKKSTMRRLCNVLHVDPEYIWEGTESPAGDEQIPLLMDSQLIPWVDMKMTAEGVEKIGTCFRVYSNRAFAWRNTTVEIESFMPVGALAFCNPDAKPENGQFVLGMFMGKPVIRMYAEVGCEIYLRATDRDFRTMALTEKDRVLAVVVGFYKPVLMTGRALPENDAITQHKEFFKQACEKIKEDNLTDIAKTEPESAEIKNS